MTLRKTVISVITVVLLSIIILIATLPNWLQSAINFTPYASSVQVEKAAWVKPMRLHFDHLTYQQNNLEVRADDIEVSWLDMLDLSLSAMKIEIQHLQVAYTNIELEESTEEAEPFQLALSEQLPVLTIETVEVSYNQVTVPIQTQLQHRGIRSDPLRIVAQYQGEKLGTFGINWNEESLSGSLVLQGSILSELAQDPLFAVQKNFDLDGIELFGEINSDFELDVVARSLNASVIAPTGGIQHKQIDFAWSTPIEVRLNTNNEQWQASLVNSINGSFTKLGAIYKQVEWPAIIQTEQLPQEFNFELKEGSQATSEQSFKGEAEVKAEGISLTLDQLQLSPEQQQGRFKLEMNSPSWAELDGDFEVLLDGDFVHQDNWIIDLTPKVTVQDWQQASLQCQLVTAETDETVNLILGNDEIQDIKGMINTRFESCKQGELQVEQLNTQLEIKDSEQAKLTFDWLGYLSGKIDLNLENSKLSLHADAQINDPGGLLKKASSELSGLAFNGTVKAEGKARLDLQQPEQISGQWQASMSGLGQYDDITFDGAEALITGELNQQAINVNPASYIQFDNLDSGVLIRDLKGLISGQVSGEDIELYLTDVNGDLLEGSLSLDRVKLNPEPNGVSLLQLDNITLDALAQLQSQPGIALQGTVSGRFPLEFDSSGVHVKEGKLYNITPGFIRVKDNPQIQNLKQSSEQAAQALNLLENLDFKTLNSSVDFTPEGDLILAVSIEGRNPDIDQAVNFNYTHEENLYQLLQSLRLGDKLTEKVQQQYQERNQ